jgi:hypothetical protein
LICSIRRRKKEKKKKQTEKKEKKKSRSTPPISPPQKCVVFGPVGELMNADIRCPSVRVFVAAAMAVALSSKM